MKFHPTYGTIVLQKRSSPTVPAGSLIVTPSAHSLDPGSGLVTNTGGSSFDSDAASFFTAAGITDSAQKAAVNDLVVALKAASIWDKMRALYPMVGGASAHKYNLKDPRDLDAAFRLSFTGGAWSHTANGAEPLDSFASYANTFFVPATHNVSQDSIHLSYYCQTNSPIATCMFIGASEPGLGMYIGDNNGAQLYSANSAGEVSIKLRTSATGLYTTTRTEAGSFNVFEPDQTKTVKSVTSVGQSTRNLYVGAMNYSSGNPYSAVGQRCAFASIGSGLSDADVVALYAVVAAYQTALGR